MITKQITKNIQIIADNYVDEMGIKRTYCEIKIIKPDGLMINIPQTPPLKVTDNTNILDATINLNEQDLEQLFEDFVIKLL